jgi:hypothetical protein
VSDEIVPPEEQRTVAEDPREVGMELLRHLERLDDRLQRSQAYMLDLVERRMPLRSENDVVVRPGSPVTTAPQDIDVAHHRERPVTLVVPDSADLDGGPPPPAANEAGTASFGDGRFPWEEQEDPTAETAAVTLPGPTVVHPPELRRPAWQSNLVTAAIAMAILLVGLAFVGAL